MRRHKAAGKSPRVVLTILILVIAFGLCSCAEKKPPAKVKRTKPPSPPTQTRIEEKQPEVIPTGPAKPRIGSNETATPARNASNALVEKGKALIASGENELAAGKFKGAIQVDPSNGQAYYYLALSYSKTDQSDLARGALDKASNLLRHDPEWSQKIDDLKAGLVDEGY